MRRVAYRGSVMTATVIITVVAIVIIAGFEWHGRGRWY